MENQLSKFMGRELKDAIASIQVVQGTAKDSGNLYYCIELHFINGFTKRIYLQSAEQFAWCNAFDLIKVNDLVNNF